MTPIRAHIAMLAFVIILGASYSARAAGFDITEFYTGKTITFIVGLENTSYARTMGRHMMKYVPGNPSLKFQMHAQHGQPIRGCRERRAGSRQWVGNCRAVAGGYHGTAGWRSG